MRLPDINDLIQDLQLAKQIAIDDRNANALIMATIGQAKLLGLDKPINDVTPHNNKIEVVRTIIDPLTPEVALAISNRLEDEY